MWAALLEGSGWRARQRAVQEPTEEDDLFSGGEGPKGNLSANQYAANEPSRDWLDAERMSAASNASANNLTRNNTTNKPATIPYQISQTFSLPIYR